MSLAQFKKPNRPRDDPSVPPSPSLKGTSTSSSLQVWSQKCSVMNRFNELQSKSEVPSKRKNCKGQIITEKSFRLLLGSLGPSRTSCERKRTGLPSVFHRIHRSMESTPHLHTSGCVVVFVGTTNTRESIGLAAFAAQHRGTRVLTRVKTGGVCRGGAHRFENNNNKLQCRNHYSFSRYSYYVLF